MRGSGSEYTRPAASNGGGAAFADSLEVATETKAAVGDRRTGEEVITVETLQEVPSESPRGSPPHVRNGIRARVPAINVKEKSAAISLLSPL